MDILEYSDKKYESCIKNDSIDRDLFSKYNVKRGLRDERGNGVLTGLTNISIVNSKKQIGEMVVSCDGQLMYRGYDVVKMVEDGIDKRFRFEEAAYLLLFGNLPNKSELSEFQKVIAKEMKLPEHFERDVIMKAPSSDIMNSMTKSVLTLSSYDSMTFDLSIPNVLRQSLSLISKFPMLAVYGYHAYNYSINNKSMYIHKPKPELSLSENFLRMLRANKRYTELEAKALDVALLLHMEHGGGNNSTFTTRVVTSAGADTYAAVAAGLSSLKGPKHGGANLMVMKMMDDIHSNISDYSDKDEIKAYLNKILDREAFDRKGLIYGIGHAVYTISDPRERVFKQFVESLAKEKGRQKDMELYQNIEDIAPELIMERTKGRRIVSPNVDFYSGFVYDMLGIPRELFTPLFAVARIVGWSAHRIEEIVSGDKIIRPAYMSVAYPKEYVGRNDR
ncbi:MAG: citrate/2-methylcitrate synthase [Lachnospiraceae bacterium]|jgi:citrate synthase